MTSSSDHGSESNPEPLYMGVYSSYELPGHPRSLVLINFYLSWLNLFHDTEHDTEQV